MSVWAARKFWTAASAVPVEGGFTVHLDARPVRTPLKAPLVLPTLALAEAVAAEWDAQDKTVDPETMPGWVQGIGRNNPITHVASASRGLMHGNVDGTEIL